MSKKEIEQIKIFERIRSGDITRKEGSLMLGISYRWVKKKYKKYELKGEEGLVHGNRGKMNKSATKQEIKIEDVVKDKLEDAGSTFIAEKIGERLGIKISKETVRKIMIQRGLWQGKTKKSVHRKRRERKSNIGILIQSRQNSL